MIRVHQTKLIGALAVLLAAFPAQAAPTSQTAAPDQVPPKNAAAPPSLIILFDSNSSRIRDQDKAILDRASRAYNEGKPIVMTLAGNSDLTGNAKANLLLSQRRAEAVLRGLLDRGIPANRFQLVAKGQTEPPVPTPEGTKEAANRRVSISWH